MPQLNKNRINRLLPKTKVLPLQDNVHGLSQTISIEEHKKVLTRNAAIIKENVVLKEQIRKLKNENVNLRANETSNDPKILDDIVIAFKLVFDEHRNLKTNLQNMMESVDNFNDIFGRCSSFFREKYPNYNVPDFENDNGFDEFWQTCEQTNERSSASSHTSSRYSMSSQERESRRKYSMDKNKNAFHIFSELSTILELSSDLRGSTGRTDVIPRLSFIGRKSNVRKSSIKCSVNVTTIEENCELENDQNISIAENIKLIQKLSANGTKLQSNDSINDINDKLLYAIDNHSEQVFPDIVQVLQRNNGTKSICSLDQLVLNEPRHCSSPITSQFNEHTVLPKDKMIVENKNANNDDQTSKYSIGSLLVEETRFDYPELNSKKTSLLSLAEVKDTPLLKRNKLEEKLEKLELESENVSESVAIPTRIENTSQITSNVEDETPAGIRPKRNLRKINKINYSEMCVDSNSNGNEEKIKRKRKQITTQSQTQSNSKEKIEINTNVKRKRMINT